MAVKIKKKKGIRSKKSVVGKSPLLHTPLQKKRGYYLLFSIVIILFILSAGVYLIRGYIQKGLQNEFDRGLTVYQTTNDKDKGDYSEALNAFQRVSKSYGGGRLRPLSDFYIGNIHYRQGNYEEALKNYERASRQFKDDYLWALALYNKGKTYEALDKLNEAIDTFNRLYRDPMGVYLKPILSLEIGMLYERVGEIDKAMETYKKLTDENPEFDMKDWVVERIDRLKDKLK